MQIWTTGKVFMIQLIGKMFYFFLYCSFSPDGELLVSQSGEPDFLITVWNWHEHKILLRTKSYVNDVYKVKFSPYVPGQLTTCGKAFSSRY